MITASGQAHVQDQPARRRLVIQPGEAVEHLIGSSLAGAYKVLAEKRKNDSYRGDYLPNRFARHHTDTLATLARYQYRDDGLLVWNAIARWAADFVGAYYRTDEDVRGDFELQAWRPRLRHRLGTGL